MLNCTGHLHDVVQLNFLKPKLPSYASILRFECVYECNPLSADTAVFFDFRWTVVRHLSGPPLLLQLNLNEKALQGKRNGEQSAPSL